MLRRTFLLSLAGALAEAEAATTVDRDGMKPERRKEAKFSKSTLAPASIVKVEPCSAAGRTEGQSTG